jgi:hypothetical protein
MLPSRQVLEGTVVMSNALPVPGFRSAPLAAALLIALGAGAGVPAAASPRAAPADTSWIRLRIDAAHRLFPQLPGPRSEATARPATLWSVANCHDDGPGSLRATVAAALDGDTVDLSSLSCGRITLETGAIALPVANLTLQGPGAGALAIDGNGLDRVFFHPFGGWLQLRDMTVEGGRVRATGFDVTGGGCIASAGYLVLEDAVVRNCYAGGEGAYGGAVYAYYLGLSRSTLGGNVAHGVHENAGTAAFGGAAFVYSMALVDSTVSGNLAHHTVQEGRTSYDIGGGIIAVRGGSISRSTIDSNVADGRGGGIAAFSDIALSNSTVSGNTAAAAMGGGVFARRPATLEIGNSTLSNNQAATAGGGIWLAATDAWLDSTLVYGNRAGSGSDIEAAYSLAVHGSANLVGSSGALVALPADTAAGDPRLGPLAWNGGATRTHALGAGSTAVDAGSNPDGLASDQRGDGFPRQFGDAIDIGAYEQQGLSGAPAASPVPALATWLQLALAALLGSAALARFRRVIGRSSGAPKNGHRTM